MGDVAVRVEGLSKQFRIGKQEQYRTFRDTLTDAVAAPFKRVGGLLRGNAYAASNLTETIWALKDVSFEVKKGEVIGIIGRNGAGKSTLLKILSQITEPTEGRAEVYGRVGALLEVGTGFHPELTGRENIYLNGAILGMSREEIKRKFDEIVAFAEVDKFIDTPVKHYSSGMGLRLGFAVAAHLEPEILVVDEVLAVGDAQFQQKCLGKMGQVAGEGHTVLFVSHNMAAINSLTTRTLCLSEGRVIGNGDTPSVIRNYLENKGFSQGYIEWTGARPGDKALEFVSCRLGSGQTIDYASDEEIEVTLEYCITKGAVGLRVGFDLISHDGIIVFRSYVDDWTRLEVIHPGNYRAQCKIPPHLLNQGRYYVTLRANIHAVRHICILERVLGFSIVNVNGVNAQYGGIRPGVINPRLNWLVSSAGSTTSY